MRQFCWWYFSTRWNLGWRSKAIKRSKASENEMVQRCHSEKNKKIGWWLVFTSRWDLPSSCMVGIFPTYIIYIHIWMDFFKEKKRVSGTFVSKWSSHKWNLVLEIRRRLLIYVIRSVDGKHGLRTETELGVIWTFWYHLSNSPRLSISPNYVDTHEVNTRNFVSTWGF